MTKNKGVGKVKIIVFITLIISVLFIVFSTFEATDSANARYVSGVVKMRAEKDQSFGLEDESPLEEAELRRFRSLHYFEPDRDFVVQATLMRTGNDSLYRIGTSDGDFRDYLKYASASFVLDGEEYMITVWQSPDTPEVLFLPFTDLTSGEDSYGAGRYLDLDKPAGSSLEIDFNLAYNPYCAYSERYSCPLPPPENHLKVRIEAGEKNFRLAE